MSSTLPQGLQASFATTGSPSRCLHHHKVSKPSPSSPCCLQAILYYPPRSLYLVVALGLSRPCMLSCPPSFSSCLKYLPICRSKSIRVLEGTSISLFLFVNFTMNDSCLFSCSLWNKEPEISIRKIFFLLFYAMYSLFEWFPKARRSLNNLSLLAARHN